MCIYEHLCISLKGHLFVQEKKNIKINVSKSSNFKQLKRHLASLKLNFRYGDKITCFRFKRYKQKNSNLPNVEKALTTLKNNFFFSFLFFQE